MAMLRSDSLELPGADDGEHPLSPQLHAMTQEISSATFIYAPESSTASQHPPEPLLTLDYGDSTHQAEDPEPKPRPKQKMVTTGRKNHGGSKPKSTTGRQRKSNTPTPAPAIPPLKLKLRNPKPAKEDQVVQPSAPPLQDEPSGGEDELPLAVKPATTTRRSGRQVRPTQNALEYVMGSELDHAIQSSSVGKADDEDYYQPDLASSPPFQSGSSAVHVLQVQPKRKPGRPPQTASFQPVLPKVDEEAQKDEPSSETIAPSSPGLVHSNGVFKLDIHPDVYTIMSSLRSKLKIQIDLPMLSPPTNPDREQPYSAKFLIHLYLVCYESRLWNLCDLIADTWIRAFHSLRNKAQQDPRYQLWRPNAALEKRQRDAEAATRARAEKKGKKESHMKGVGYDDHAPDYKLDVADPALEFDVTDFDSPLLYDLYLYTEKNCGARFLWADAMALGGDKMEDVLEKTTRRGQTWHPDLLFNIMNTGLRMVRRKLTLKIEEACEGAWCRRYHEHAKHGLPCYRELAWKHAKDGDDSSGDEAEVINKHADGDDLETIMEAEFRRAEKRGYEDVAGGEMPEAKRVQVVEKEITDLDAEGDSEEEN